jgi:glucan-binding YG repeat protein
VQIKYLLNYVYLGGMEMKKKLLNQLFAAALVCGSLLSVGNVSAYADTKLNGMKTENGHTYSYHEGVKDTNQWIMYGDKNGGAWHYFDENGEMVKNKTMIGPNNKTEVKIDENGVGQVDWEYGVDEKYENGKYYYVNAAGQKTGWVKDAELYKMHYYNENGEMLKDTTVKNQLGKEVKLNKDGVLVGEHGYEILDGVEVTYDSSEAYKKSQKEWKQVGSDWTYNDGTEKKESLAKGWEQINGVWFYFNDNGIMQKNTTVKDGKGNDCVLNADGALTNRTKPEEKDIEVKNEYTPKVIDGKTYFVDAKGVNKIGWVMYDGKWHYTNKEGVMQKDTTIIDGDKKYVLDANGAWIN